MPLCMHATHLQISQLNCCCMILSTMHQLCEKANIDYPNFDCCHDVQDQGSKQTGGLTLPFDLPYQNDRPKSPENLKAELQESLDKTKQDREAKTEQSKKERQQRQKQKERDKDGSICYSLLDRWTVANCFSMHVLNNAAPGACYVFAKPIALHNHAWLFC